MKRTRVDIYHHKSGENPGCGGCLGWLFWGFIILMIIGYFSGGG